MTNIREQLSTLFQEAGGAHHHAFIATDGADDEWPLWYAQFLKERLSQLLGKTLTVSELVYALITLDKQLKAEASGAFWPAYYADYFIKHYLEAG